MSGMLALAAAFGSIIAVGALAVLINDAIEARLRPDLPEASGGDRQRPAPRWPAVPAGRRPSAILRAAAERPSHRGSPGRSPGRARAGSPHGDR